MMTMAAMPRMSGVESPPDDELGAGAGDAELPGAGASAEAAGVGVAAGSGAVSRV